MIRLSITVESTATNAFLVRLSGKIDQPKALNDALGRRLARELQGLFRAKNAEPNKMGAEKTNFWEDVSESTQLEEVTDTGAVVAVAEQRFRIHLFGGTIRAKQGKFMTIPLVKEARGKWVRVYEAQYGRKVFRLPGSRVLVERNAEGDRSLVSTSKATVRGRTGYRKISIGGRTPLRAVYALAESVTIRRDPRALPDPAKLAAALLDTGNSWLSRNLNREPQA